MANWIKTLAGGLCIMTVLLQLVPDGKFAKYVKFYAGLLFFLMAARPAVILLAGDGELERLLKLEFLKEEHYELESAVKGMADLKNDRIMQAYRQEVERQIRGIVSAYEVEVCDLSVQFAPDNEYQIKSIALTVCSLQSASAEALREEIAGVYMIAQDCITVNVREAGEGT